ncbi:DNA-binding transcriptional regulator, AcrR family [bacterium A37T11]|nr:DNA-binding transcriptional regulator, AcrR family [bacterium A37T11]
MPFISLNGGREPQVQKIIWAAIPLFKKYGYSGFQMVELGHKVGISRMHLYGLVGPKDELLLMCVKKLDFLLRDKPLPVTVDLVLLGYEIQCRKHPILIDLQRLHVNKPNALTREIERQREKVMKDVAIKFALEEQDPDELYQLIWQGYAEVNYRLMVTCFIPNKQPTV